MCVFHQIISVFPHDLQDQSVCLISCVLKSVFFPSSFFIVHFINPVLSGLPHPGDGSTSWPLLFTHTHTEPCWGICGLRLTKTQHCSLGEELAQLCGLTAWSFIHMKGSENGRMEGNWLDLCAAKVACLVGRRVLG